MWKLPGTKPAGPKAGGGGPAEVICEGHDLDCGSTAGCGGENLRAHRCAENSVCSSHCSDSGRVRGSQPGRRSVSSRSHPLPNLQRRSADRESRPIRSSARCSALGGRAPSPRGGRVPHSFTSGARLEPQNTLSVAGADLPRAERQALDPIGSRRARQGGRWLLYSDVSR
jgi:hypothetical protein